jgi:hypothetical protein
MTRDPSKLIKSALKIAAGGLPIFALNAQKKPITPNGFYDATRDPSTISQQFSMRAAVLIGVPTGEISGFNVMDIDPRHNGDAWLRENAHRLPETRVHGTPGGGFHYLFNYVPGVRNDQGKRIAQGVDIRGEGGYVGFPPIRYSVVKDAPIAHWPTWLLEKALTPPAPKRPEPSGPRQPISSKRLDAFVGAILDNVRNAPDGQKHYVLRNNAITLGGIADQAGLSDDECWELLRSALPASVQDWRNAEKTARWGLGQGRLRPIALEDRSPERPPIDWTAIKDPIAYTAGALRRSVLAVAAAGTAQELRKQTRSLCRLLGEHLGPQDIGTAMFAAGYAARLSERSISSSVVMVLRGVQP